MLGFLVALVLLGAGSALLVGTGAAFDGRDAFAARVERGTAMISPRRMAAEWRSEIAAQRHTARRDRMLGFLLLGTGVVAVAALAVQHRMARRAPVASRAGAEAAA